MSLDETLVSALEKADGEVIIKAAGNLGYPMGLYLEKLATELVPLAQKSGLPLEAIVGAGELGELLRPGPVAATLPRMTLPVITGWPWDT